MIDTMTATKVVGALCGALLIFLLGGWAAEELYHVGGHGEGEQAYAIEVPEGGEAEGEEVVEVAFEEVFAAADAGAGESVWRQCSACHALEDGANGTGPHLFGIVGRPQAAVGEYAYSAAFAELAGEWTAEELDGFLENPSEWVPGTKMTYRGLADVEDRANLIAYMQGFGG